MDTVMTSLSVRRKAALVVLATCLLLIAIFVLFSRFVLSEGFTRIEDTQARAELRRVASEVASREASLVVATRDWSNWDDTYDFTQKQNPAYVRSNLTDAGIENLGLDAMVFLDKAGRVIAARGRNDRDELTAAAPDGLVAAIKERSSREGSEAEEDVSGIVLLPDGIFLLASLPVRDSEGTSEARGSLTWGYFLDDSIVKGVADKVGVGVSIHRWDSADLPPAESGAKNTLTDGEGVHIDRISESRIRTYGVLTDIFGRPAAIISSEGDRDVAGQGRATETYVVAGAILSTLAFGIVILLLLDNVVLRRLAQLAAVVGRAGRGESEPASIAISGGDEIASLAKAISDAMGELSSSQEELRRSEERFKGISDYAHDAIVVMNPAGIVEFWNPAAETLFGRSASEVTGKLTFDRVLPDDAFKERMHSLLDESTEWQPDGSASPPGSFESFALRRDGFTSPVEVSTFRVHLTDQVMVAAIVRDISERLALVEVQRLSRRDELTNLPNRLLFNEIARKSAALLARSGDRMAMHLIDIDHFKEVNEGLGPESGDALIVAVARRLSEVVRTGDTVARLGGDEFAVLQTNLIDENHAGLFAEKLLDVFSAPFHFAGQEIYVTASVGVVTYPLVSIGDSFHADAFDPQQLLREADIALYRSKDDGRNTYRFYDEAMGSMVLERMRLTQELRLGIEREELLLQFQPQVDIRTGALVGAEALVRWNHPERGMVAPDQFIPAAEASGLIVPLGEWVMEQACLATLALEDAGVLLPRMCVNLSSVQFRRQDVVEMVASILDETGLTADRLEIELTESVVVKDTSTVSRALRGLHQRGVDIAMDDFGTGYSSLSYLQTFHFDRLKIDRSFVSRCVEDDGAGKIVDAMVHLGHEMGLKVIAEGVETNAQLRRIHASGCDEVQGFLTGRPVDLPDLITKVRAGEFCRSLVGAEEATAVAETKSESGAASVTLDEIELSLRAE